MRIKFSITELAEWRSFADSDLGKSAKNFFVSIFRNITTSSNKFDIFITVFLLFFHVLAYKDMIRDLWRWNGEGFQHALSSWLMTYSGGFVRRGLSGEIIRVLEIVTNFLPHIIVGILSILIFVLLVILTTKICVKKIPFYFLLSPVFFAISARWDIVFSTDYLILLMFLCALIIITSNKNYIIKYIFVNIICALAILIKEIYIFSCLPLLMVTYSLRFHDRFFSLRSIPYFALPVISSVAVLIFNSNSHELILKTAEFWNEVYREKIPDFCCFYVGTFGYYEGSWIASHLHLMKYNLSLVLYGFIWVPLVWIFLWYFCGVFTAKIIRHYDSEYGKENLYLSLYYFSTICSLPLYLIEYDWGRWILISSITSFLVTYAIYPFVNSTVFVEKLKLRVWKSPLRLWQKFLIVTCFGVPSYIADFGQYYYSTPIWYPLHYIVSIPELNELGLLGK